MTDTTTIEITQDQKAELDKLKAHSRESYKSVLDDLLDDGIHTTEVIPASDIDGVESKSQTVELEATTINQIADEVERRLGP
jgi:nucleotidyltransferase/DNA polymerase involved in DNA repair